MWRGIVLASVCLSAAVRAEPTDAPRPLSILTARGMKGIIPSDGGYDRWQDYPELDAPRAHQMVASLGNRFFTFSGKASPGSPMDSLVLEYDLASCTWTGMQPMPTSRGIGQAVTVRDRIYVLGGCQTFGTGLDDVEEYFPAQDSWSVLSPMPIPNHDFGAAVWRDSLVYVLGGGNWYSPVVCSAYIFDPAADRWFSATPLPLSLGAMAVGIVGNDIVISTGFSGGMVNTTLVGAIDPADPTRITWRSGPAFPGELRCRTVSGVFGDELFLIGGTLNSGGVSAEVWSLNPDTGTWTRWDDKPVGIANVYGLAIGSDSVLYIPGGFPWTTPYARVNQGLNLTAPAHDVGVLSLTPAGRVRPGRNELKALVRNYGRSPETFELVWNVTSGLAQSQGTRQFALAAGQTADVGLGQVEARAGESCWSTVRVVLAEDERPENDRVQAAGLARIGSEPDAFGYTYQSTQEPDTTAFDWIDATAGTRLTGWLPNSDEGYVSCRLPFRFPYYEQGLEQVNVFTNGCLETDTWRYHYNESLPCRGRNRIAVWWDDLDLRAAGAVYQYNDPLGEFTVFAWFDVPRFRYPDQTETFEVVLYRNGVIRYNYLHLTGTLTSNTIGIQGREGLQGGHLQYAFNGAPARHIVSDSVSVVFYPVPRVNQEDLPRGRREPAWRIPSPWHGSELVLPAVTQPGQVTIFEMTGRRVREYDMAIGSRTVSLSGLANGVYLVRLQSPDLDLKQKLVLAR